MLPTRESPQNKRPTQPESEWLDENIPSKWTGKKKKNRLAIFTSDKIDLKNKAIKRDTEGHFIILNGRIRQRYINILNIYAPHIGAPKYIRKILEDSRKI